MKFSLLHPTRSRINRSTGTTSKWLSRAGSDDVEVIVSVDENDMYRRQYISAYEGRPKTKIISNSNRSAVDAVNNAAKVCTGEVMIVVSDDSDCPNNWVSILENAIGYQKDFVLKTFDGVQKWIVTMPILDRTYYNRFGFVYHPDYTHMFVDTDFTHVADVLQKIIWRNDIVFPHLHYSVTKLRRDTVSEKADESWSPGKSLYLRRFKERFGLEDTINVWNVSSDGHRKWLQDSLR